MGCNCSPIHACPHFNGGLTKPPLKLGLGREITSHCFRGYNYLSMPKSRCYFSQSILVIEAPDNMWHVENQRTVYPIKICILMMTSSNGNIFRVTGPLCGEFTGPGEFPTQRPVTRSFDVFFDLRPNKRLSKQSWGWLFETLSRSLWRHCNVFGCTCTVVLYEFMSFSSSYMWGFGDNTDLLWWNNVNNQFCQLTTRVSYQRGIRWPFKCTGNHTYWGLKNNWGMRSKNGLQNLWGNTVFFIIC